MNAKDNSVYIEHMLDCIHRIDEYVESKEQFFSSHLVQDAVIGTVAAAPIIAAIAVGIITGYILNKLDEKYGATAALIAAYEKMGIKLKEIEYEAARWYNYFETNPNEIMRLFGAPGRYSYGGY